MYDGRFSAAISTSQNSAMNTEFRGGGGGGGGDKCSGYTFEVLHADNIF
jgi:hypothetical protein